VHVSNLFYVEHRAELARDVVELLAVGGRCSLQTRGPRRLKAPIKLARRWAGEHKPGDIKGRVARAQLPWSDARSGLQRPGRRASKRRSRRCPRALLHVPAERHLRACRGSRHLGCGGHARGSAGEGGVWPLTAEYLRAARSILRRTRLPAHPRRGPDRLLPDGSRLRSSSVRRRPDVITVAKGARERAAYRRVPRSREVAAALKPGDHGSTFGGGPAICAAGRATVAASSPEKLGANALEVGGYLMSGLFVARTEHRSLTDVSRRWPHGRSHPRCARCGRRQRQGARARHYSE